ncbi:MAG: hemolysin III family protein [Actinomycetes bacterium]
MASYGLGPATLLDDVRPLLRGWLHAATVPIAVVAAVLVAMRAPAHLRLAVAVYGVTTVLIFSTSAIYHRLAFPTRFRAWWQRADHSAIFLFIVGTYTPVAVVSTGSRWSWLWLSMIWAVGLIGIVAIWTVGIRPAVNALYGVLGWTGLLVLWPFVHSAGVAAAVLLIVGGLCYSAGALASLKHRPDPWPSVFGYHEVFHAMTLVAAGCQYAAVMIAITRHA